MKWAWFPGCVSKGFCSENYKAMVALGEKMGLELVELKGAACTGAGVLHERDPVLADTLNARTFAMAEQLGLPLLNNCSTCQGVMSKVQDHLKKDPDALAMVNATLEHEGLQYSGISTVKTLLWALVEDFGLDRFRSHVTRPLTGLRVAPFYGCYIVRPSRILGFDEFSERDTYLEMVIEACGAEVVDFSGKHRCCGFPILTMNKQNSLSMAGDHLSQAQRRGADVMVTPCPLCHLNLDANQPDVEKVKKQRIGLPVLHLSQLLGLAVGIPPQSLGLNMHMVSTRTVVSKVSS